MTQRVDLSTVMDRLAIDEVVTGFGVAVDDDDWGGFRTLFTQDGRADYTEAGGIEGTADEVARWLADSMRHFPVRQHLIVNRRVRIQDLGGYPGDRADLLADYLNPSRFESGEEFMSGGRYVFGLVRVEEGWRLNSVVVHEKWRRSTGAPTGARAASPA
jgi:hypothetical protein